MTWYSGKPGAGTSRTESAVQQGRQGQFEGARTAVGDNDVVRGRAVVPRHGLAGAVGPAGVDVAGAVGRGLLVAVGRRRLQSRLDGLDCHGTGREIATGGGIAEGQRDGVGVEEVLDDWIHNGANGVGGALRLLGGDQRRPAAARLGGVVVDGGGGIHDAQRRRRRGCGNARNGSGRGARGAVLARLSQLARRNATTLGGVFGHCAAQTKETIVAAAAVATRRHFAFPFASTVEGVSFTKTLRTRNQKGDQWECQTSW